MRVAFRRFLSGREGKVLVLTFAALLAVAVPSATAFFFIVDATVIRLGTLFAEKQILFDRYRGLESLMREVSLAETVARSPAIVDWAGDEKDADKTRRGLAELEHYRLSFKDMSYFVVLGGTGNYYFNDRANAYADNQLRYTLSPDNPRDGWYYKTAARGSGCHLNVDHDDNLGVTKVWINCVISGTDGKALGIIGTGVDLSRFIREVVDIPQNGVQSIFVDRSGAVQAHRDPRLVDFHSLTKDLKAKKTVFGLLSREADQAKLTRMMEEVAAGSAPVRSAFLEVEGKKTLVGVGYLNQLGWYNVTLMDVDTIIDRRLFTPIALLLAAILLAATALMTFMFKRSVLDRLQRLEASADNVRRGRFEDVEVDSGADEIGRLSRTFSEMARAVGDKTGHLEHLVRERTEKLEQLAHVDPLTGIFNRRGFERAFIDARTAPGRTGLCLVDLDRFKPVNDARGHEAGDVVLRETVARIRAVLRPGDRCGRWGGDEFIVLVAEADPVTLSTIAARIVSAMSDTPIIVEKDAEPLWMTVSVGGCLVGPTEAIESAAARADKALYDAKAAGRGTFRLYEARHSAEIVTDRRRSA